MTSTDNRRPIMTELAITVRQRPGFHLVQLEGELDSTTQLPLSQTFNELLTEAPPKIVVDAARLAFCDSSGLWTLITGQREAEDRGGGLRLIGVHGPLARLLSVTRLVDMFPSYASLDQAAHWPGPR
ncbi:STAS domain-containing protein [Nonomuraea sp. MTCD27]|uniref:STAS domain-containing protein n=1 Tax=Nonomuraea sp. MTCD27 TaxID=1676747 RepID=UPI0035C1540F